MLRLDLHPNRLLASLGLSLLVIPGPAVSQSIPSAGAAPMAWAECQPGQIEVMIVGTFHFAQSTTVDVLEPARQEELSHVLDALESFTPDLVAVEFPRTRADELQTAFAAYRSGSELESPNEISQLGFRLAGRLGHESVHAVDVPMNLWHDSIQVFDDAYPTSRDGLRARWPGRHASVRRNADLTLREMLIDQNRDDPPANSEMYAGFLPLAEGEMYAGALKLRPWYDRNLRIIQNLFRAGQPEDERWLLIIGSGHLRVLTQMMEMTPQLCPVSALEVLEG